ncbi:MAG: hypothetical protein R2727_05305 [Bacteroidales bacterium]
MSGRLRRRRLTFSNGNQGEGIRDCSCKQSERSKEIAELLVSTGLRPTFTMRDSVELRPGEQVAWSTGKTK